MRRELWALLTKIACLCVLYIQFITCYFFIIPVQNLLFNDRHAPNSNYSFSFLRRRFFINPNFEDDRKILYSFQSRKSIFINYLRSLEYKKLYYWNMRMSKTKTSKWNVIIIVLKTWGRKKTSFGSYFLVDLLTCALS